MCADGVCLCVSSDTYRSMGGGQNTFVSELYVYPGSGQCCLPGLDRAASVATCLNSWFAVATCLNSWFAEANVCIHFAHLLCSSGLAVSKRAFPAKICKTMSANGSIGKTRSSEVKKM